MRWLSFGVEFIGVLGVFSYAGWALDRKLQHRWPWLMLVGFAFAFAGMMVLLVKETRELRK